MAESDVLSEVLGHLRLRGEVFCRTKLGRHTSLSFPTGQAHFHVIERGPCWVSVPTESHSVVANAGDLLLLVGGNGHSVSAVEKDAREHPLMEVIPIHYDAKRLSLDLSDGDSCVEMVCGRFAMDAVGSEALIGALPTVVHLRGHQGAADGWLTTTLHLLSAETTANRPGSARARARLVDLVLVGAIRRWLEENQQECVGWLTALRDPVVGKALALLHAEPGHPWTVPEIAARVGLSRSPFAARFRNQVGSSPMRYLTSWRMRLAARMLSEGSSVGETAQGVGYESDASFSRVFKREMGVPPSTLRPKNQAPRGADARRGGLARAVRVGGC